MDNSQTTLWDLAGALKWNKTLPTHADSSLMTWSCLLTFKWNSGPSLRTFLNSCQLFLPARNRRPSWFSPLNQILLGERRGGGTPKTSLVLSFPLWRQKDVIIWTKLSVISGTRSCPCRLLTGFTRSHRPRGFPEGGLVLINKKLQHKSVPVQLEKEAVVTVEASAQRSCCCWAAPSPDS